MTLDPTIGVGDTVVVRNTYGWWHVATLRLETNEVVVTRASLRRVVPADDVRPARQVAR